MGAWLWCLLCCLCACGRFLCGTHVVLQTWMIPRRQTTTDCGLKERNNPDRDKEEKACRCRRAGCPERALSSRFIS